MSKQEKASAVLCQKVLEEVTVGLPQSRPIARSNRCPEEATGAVRSLSNSVRLQEYQAVSSA